MLEERGRHGAQRGQRNAPPARACSSVTLVDASAGLLGRPRAALARAEEKRRADEAASRLLKRQPARHAAGAPPDVATWRPRRRCGSCCAWSGGGGGGEDGGEDGGEERGAFDTGRCRPWASARRRTRRSAAGQPRPRGLASAGACYLLEHGRATSPAHEWLNELLDRTAVGRAEEVGCWWNRDVGELVRKSGLVVESCRRSNFGTTWCMVLSGAAGWVDEAGRGREAGCG